MLRARLLVRHVAALTVAGALTTACAEPPAREISQAQGALDAARAAGAEAYAKTDVQAADAALTRAHAAVAARDYRQALGHALEARERARAAAREASAARARLATRVALGIDAAARGIADARARVRAGQASRALATELDALETQLQEARSALAGGDYAGAAERTRTVQERVSAITATWRTRR
jgi:hypothetical protein